MMILAEEVDGRSGAMSKVSSHGRHGRGRLSSASWAESEGEDSDGNGPERSHDMCGGWVADAASVLVEGEVPAVVQAVLNGPVPADETSEFGLVGFRWQQAGDAVGDFVALGAIGKDDFAFNGKDLSGVRVWFDAAQFEGGTEPTEYVPDGWQPGYARIRHPEKWPAGK